MSYRYIVLMDASTGAGGQSHASTEIKSALIHAGLEAYEFCASATLYASRGTPVLKVPGNGFIVGHLFGKDGHRIAEKDFPQSNTTSADFRQHVIKNLWGEYVLLQPPQGDGADFTVMRDPSGGIRCVYHLGSRANFVTSDVSLAIHLGLFEKRIDWNFIPHCLAYPNLKTERSAIQGVGEVLPGCVLHIRGANAASSMAWSPWNFVTCDNRPSSLSDAAADIRHAVSVAVKAWAETDGSILLELSGGLDSSIVAACLPTSSVRVECCNLTTAVPGADERQYAQLMSDRLGVDLRVVQLGFDHAKFEYAPPAYSITPQVWLLQHAADQAIASLGNALGLSSYFSGGGGDSVFGYLTGAAPAADALLDSGLRHGVMAVRDLSRLHQCTFWKAARLTLRKAVRAHKLPIKADQSFLTAAGKASEPARHPWFEVPAGILPGDRERVHELVNTQGFRDGTPRSESRWLRMPLLSQPVVECCLRVPSWMWIAGGRNRSVARSAFSDRLPPEILNRRSKGTFVNYTGAAFRRNKDEIRDFLLAGQLQARGLLQTDALNSIFQQARPVQEATFMRLFELCMVENWVRHQSLRS